MIELEEWHDFDTTLRREHVLFEVESPHFLVREHRTLVCLELFDDRRGHIRISIRRPRKFFNKLLPGAKFFFWRWRRLPRLAVPAARCSALCKGILDK